ncbi:MAG: polysaccharide deacetylase family protein [Anaerotignum sp.]|nr:polysaccharide deacetylase family protein [Anaerotignum sp.]
MKRYSVIGRKKSIWFLIGAVIYVLVVLLGLRNMAASLTSGTNQELPVYSVERKEPLIALTFNCAWDENDIPQLLALLEKERINATFFLVGQWIEEYPDSVRQIATAGHEIGNHSYSHVDFVGAGEDVIRQQMEKTDALIQGLTGLAPTLARVPSGSYDSRVIRLLRQEGYEVIQWDVELLDRV